MILMIKTIIIIILSFILDSNLSNYIPINTSLFNTMFVISSLIIISELIIYQEKFYFIAVITGIFYDFLFTNRLGFSILTFLLTAIFIKNSDKLIKTKIDIIKYLIMLIFYRVVSYLILLFVGYFNFDISKFFMSIYSSLLLNLIYIIILKKIFIKNKH